MPKPVSKPPVIRHTMAQIHALLEVAYKAIDSYERPHIAQIVWRGEHVYATDGHRMVRVPTGVKLKPEEEFAISRHPLDWWVSRLPTTWPAVGRHEEPGKPTDIEVEIELLTPTEPKTPRVALFRVLPPPPDEKIKRWSGATPITLPTSESCDRAPDFAQIIAGGGPAGLDKWPPLMERHVKPHALDARYLESLGSFVKAFALPIASMGLQTVHCGGNLDPVFYGFESKHGKALVVIMPLRVE